MMHLVVDHKIDWSTILPISFALNTQVNPLIGLSVATGTSSGLPIQREKNITKAMAIPKMMVSDLKVILFPTIIRLPSVCQV
jgi:hypothetical protein